jgi:hypothetical protein
LDKNRAFTLLKRQASCRFQPPLTTPFFCCLRETSPKCDAFV